MLTILPRVILIAQVSPKLGTDNANPVLDFLFSADPTSVEFEGRLYVYGTGDHEQYEKAEKNGYEKIKTLVMMSTDDMVNWTYHGLIPVGELAPWIINSWAPSIISRKEADGKTHFYLYFSNSGYGTGVLTAESPVGPWKSPLDRSLVDAHTPGLGNCDVPFDPGAVIDDAGRGWITFGARNSRIAELGDDLISIKSSFVPLPAKSHFEANELNYINGTYVYTYNLDWEDHKDWNLSSVIPPRCCMSYMTSTTPLDSASWHYENMYLKNPGDFGYFEHSNNHTHLHKYDGKWYLFYHTLMLQRSFGTHGGFRSICVDEVNVDEVNVHIDECTASVNGVSQIRNLNPYRLQQAETSAATEGIRFEQGDKPGNMYVRVGTMSVTDSNPEHGIIELRGVDFGRRARTFRIKASGNGSIKVCVDNPEGPVLALLETEGDAMHEFKTKCNKGKSFCGVHRLYFVLSGDVRFDQWMFTGR
ncbi:MAG: family 43 glycosylhydrolase [Bacteroidaceae bacterium]|nr:family 43 glycosylhydrolase [Bacteroidaceae bacterium]